MKCVEFQDAKHQRAVLAGGQHLFELTAEACLVVESGDGVVGVRDVLTGDVILDVRFHAQKFQTIGNGFRPVAEDWLIGKYTVVGEHHISHGALGKKERAEIRHRARSFWKEAGELCGSGVKLGGMFVGENGVTDHVLALGVLLVPVLPQTECDLLHMGNEIVKLLEHRQKFLYGAAFCQTQFQLAE